MDKSGVHLQNVSRAKIAAIALLLLVSTSFGFVGGWIGSQAGSDQFSGGNGLSQQIINEEQLISAIAEEISPSVVSVSVTSQRTSGFFDFSEPVEQESAGTGFIVSEDGIVVTNRHVIPDNTSDITITMADGTNIDDVEIVGRTSEGDPLDVAFLRIRDARGQKLKPVELGDSSDVRVGHRVVAIGNALGQFQNTVTTGIISGYGRNVRAADATGVDSLQNLFQTDAAINRGNSGGPLVNAQGQVIGINTAVAGGRSQGIGFAIPINDVKGLINSVLETGEVRRPFIGVRYISLTDDFARQNDLGVMRGAYIIPSDESDEPSVIPDSPADKAGLRPGDVITKVNGKSLDDNNTLTSLIGVRSVGDEITLTVVRDGEERKFELTLEAAPSN
ncbi:hypothetical protein BH23PAT1_BH23PAT1_3730 [soil metagenome]